MTTLFRKLSPSQAWEEAQRRSLAIGIAGWAVVGTLQAGGAIPTIYRATLAPASGLVAAFLTSMTLSLAYYHRRWRPGVLGAAHTLLLPYSVGLLWVRFTGRSLIYPLFSLTLIGVVILAFAHHRISELQPEDDVEEAIARKMIEEIGPLAWVDRVILLCIVVGVVLLLALLLR